MPPLDWLSDEARALLELQKKPLDVPPESELEKPVHSGVYQPHVDLTPGQQMTAESVKPRDGFGILHDDMDNPGHPIKGLFYTKRFADGGFVEEKKKPVAEKNANEPKAPEGPSDVEKRDLVQKALREKTLKLDEGGEVPAGLPVDAPQESKWQTIMNALGMAGKNATDTLTKPLQAVTAPGRAIGDAGAPLVNPMIQATNHLTGLNLPPASTPPAPVAADVAATPAPTAPAVPKAPAVAPAGVGTPDPLAQLGKFDPSTVAPGFNPQDRQTLANQGLQNQHTFGNYLSEALAGFGDAVAAKGGVQQNSLGNIFAMQTQQRHEALENFDKARAAAVEHFTMKNQADQALINNIKARGELQVSPGIAHALGHPELAGKPVAQAELVLKTDALKYDHASKMQERKQSALKNAADEVDKALAHGGVGGTQKMMDAKSQLNMIHAQAVKNDPEAFGYRVTGGK